MQDRLCEESFAAQNQRVGAGIIPAPISQPVFVLGIVFQRHNIGRYGAVGPTPTM
jgi:hypothetical protein